MIAAGPLARVARPKKRPKKKEVKEVEEVNEVNEVKDRNRPAGVVASCEAAGADGTRLRSFVAKTIAMVSMAAKGMSVAAAWEKPIRPTVVGRRRRNQRAASAPRTCRASQAKAHHPCNLEYDPFWRAVVSLTPKSLKLSPPLQYYSGGFSNQGLP